MDLSPYVEWFACVAVALLAILGKRWQIRVVVICVVAATWWRGSAKALLLPLVVAAIVSIRDRGRLRPWFRWLTLGAVVSTAVLCWLFPLPEPPALPGRFGVGTLAMELPAEGKSPRLKVQLWYPSDGLPGRGAVRWLPDSELAPRFPFHRIAGAKAHARDNGRLYFIKEPLRVLFYEHGWMGHRAENIAQVEALASEGYVVVAIDHPGQASRVKYNDSSVASGELPEDPPLSTPQEVVAFQALAEKCLAERLEQIERVRLALAQEAPGPLRGHLDVERAGVFGFSFGGSTAIRLCATNPHFTAGVDEDGLFIGDESPRGPFFFFDDELPPWLLAPAAPGEAPSQALVRSSDEKIRQAVDAHGCQRLIVDGANHETFTDRIFLCRYPRLAKAGKKPAKEVHQVIVENLSRFFDGTLK